MSVISYIIAAIVVAQFVNRIKRKQQSRAHQPQPQPSAPQWMSNPESDPEGRTEEYKEFDEDWINPVTPTLQDEIRTLGESQHEIVHESVHETVHVRQRRHEAPAPATSPEPHPMRLNKQTLAQALLLNEVLGEPRSKRPWHPNRRS